MEREIGEIFELDGEWYQCIESDSCGECSLFTTECGSGTKSDLADKIVGQCSKIRRTDNKHVIFKKLEKVGEPYINKGRTYQLYKLLMNIEKLPPHTEGITLVRFDLVEIENKEDMEEKKLNLKPFDIQKAREGKPVCTRDGHKARIICFDAKGMHQPIIALITQDNGIEHIETYYVDGRFNDDGNSQSDYDLMMLSEKKEGWILLRKDGYTFDNEEVAKKNCTDEQFVAKVEWEE